MGSDHVTALVMKSAGQDLELTRRRASLQRMELDSWGVLVLEDRTENLLDSHDPLRQRFPNFLAPWTGFISDNIFTDRLLRL